VAFHLYEDTWEQSTTTGTSAYVLAGAVAGWRPFSAQYSNTDTLAYSAYDGTNFEHGIGTYNSGANSLSRTTIYRSTNSNAAVNWSAGTRQIVVAPLGIMFEQFIAPGSTGYMRQTGVNGRDLRHDLRHHRIGHSSRCESVGEYDFGYSADRAKRGSF